MLWYFKTFLFFSLPFSFSPLSLPSFSHLRAPGGPYLWLAASEQSSAVGAWGKARLLSQLPALCLHLPWVNTLQHYEVGKSIIFFPLAHCILQLHCSAIKGLFREMNWRWSQFSFDQEKLVWSYFDSPKDWCIFTSPLPKMMQTIQKLTHIPGVDAGATACCPLLELELHQQENVWQKQQNKLGSLCSC